MRRLRPLSVCAVASLCALLGAASAARAADFTFTGTFLVDDESRLFSFTLLSPATVTLSTSSYVTGGFDPMLFLAQGSNGLLIGTGVDKAATDFDDTLTQALGAGTYSVGMTQYDNDAVGPLLGNGFLRTGEGNFTQQFAVAGSGIIAPFLDANGVKRTSNYSLTIANVTTAVAVTPEPATGLLVALLVVPALRRRRA